MDQLANIPLTYNQQSLAIVAGTGADLTGTGTFTFAIKGKTYTHAVWTNQAIPDTDQVTGAAFVSVGASEGCVFVICVGTAGTPVTSQGPIIALSSTGAFVTAPQFPMVPDSVCPVAYYIVKSDSTGTGYVYGTDNPTGGTGLTHTFVNIATLPSRPQIA